MSERTSLREIALLFLRLGSTAFGGPAVHIAMMRDEVVTRRRWMTEERFLDLLGATNLIPGPNSTEMALHVGWSRRGGLGLVVAGLAFILPAAVITGALAWMYVRSGTLPAFAWLLYGVKPVILVLVALAGWSLARTGLRSVPSRWLAGIALVLAVLGVHEIAVLLGAGVLAALLGRIGKRAGTGGTGAHAWAPLLGVPLAGIGGAGAASVSLPALFWVFFKTGSVLFGSGYVLLAYLRADLVERLGWLTESELVDAIAVGQATPGPVLTTATFIGFVLDGVGGAAVATAGIFLPAFLLVAASGPLVPRLRSSRVVAAFLDGVIAASLALLAVVTVELARVAFVDVPTVLLGIAAAAVLVFTRLNSTWIVLGGAAAGWIAHQAGLAATG